MRKEKKHGQDVYLVKCNSCGKEMMLFFGHDSDADAINNEVLKGNAQCLGSMAMGDPEKMVKHMEQMFVCQNCLKFDPMSKICGTTRNKLL
jgi:hypothetical protein